MLGSVDEVDPLRDRLVPQRVLARREPHSLLDEPGHFVRVVCLVLDQKPDSAAVANNLDLGSPFSSFKMLVTFFSPCFCRSLSVKLMWMTAFNVGFPPSDALSSRLSNHGGLFDSAGRKRGDRDFLGNPPADHLVLRAVFGSLLALRERLVVVASPGHHRVRGDGVLVHRFPTTHRPLLCVRDRRSGHPRRPDRTRSAVNKGRTLALRHRSC